MNLKKTTLIVMVITFVATSLNLIKYLSVVLGEGQLRLFDFVTWTSSILSSVGLCVFLFVFYKSLTLEKENFNEAIGASSKKIDERLEPSTFDDSEPVPEDPTDELSGENWYFKKDLKRGISQVVLTVDAGQEVQSQFGSLALMGQYQNLINNELALGLFRLDDHIGPYLLVKVDDIGEEVKKHPLRVCFSFIKMPSGGLFAIFVDSPVMKDNFKNPNLEMIYGLDEVNGVKRAEDSMTKDTLEIVLAGAGGMSGIECQYDIKVPFEEKCKEILLKEWNSLLVYHKENILNDFQESAQEMYCVFPEGETPILDL